MSDFYNEVNPAMVDITIDSIMNQMPNDPKVWRVNKPNFQPHQQPKPRYFHGRHCTNCNRDGHNAKSCTEAKRRKICIMCLKEGHTYLRCPNQHCLRCMSNTDHQAFSENCRKCRYLDTMDCRNCGGRGHIQSGCPDIWRRYHATTDATQGQNHLF